MNTPVVKVGLIGLGTVGGGVAQLMLEKKEQLSAYLGAELVLAKAADQRPELAAALGLSAEVFSTDARRVVEDPEIDIVVELIGGTGVAKELMLTALSQGKHVCTANKALLAECGKEIFAAAAQTGAGIGFEASVGGGIPLIDTLRQSLAGNHIWRCLGILNGTCNYILTQMTHHGASFADVLKDAQDQGFAEADPTFDIEGKDTAHKLAIIASLVTGSQPRLEDISVEGITRITPADIRFADEFGYRIKLLAILNQTAEGVEARVHPSLVPKDHVLASVDGAYNALFLTGDWVDNILLYGPGAGRRPTASAVVGDVLKLARDLIKGCPGRVPPLGSASAGAAPLALKPMDQTVAKYYFRFTVTDQPGVMAAISTALGANGISIEAMTQKQRGQGQGRVPVVMLTHEAREAQVRAALKVIDVLPVITEPTMLMRVAGK